MTKLLLMLKRAAAVYPRLKRSAGYPSFQPTRGYTAASTSVRRAVGTLSPSAGGLAGRRLFGGDHKFSHEGSQDSKGEKDKDAAKMTKKFYPIAVLAFALICLLLVLDQRRKLLDSISKNMDEVVQKMEHLNMDEVVQKMENLTEVMRQTDHRASTALGFRLPPLHLRFGGFSGSDDMNKQPPPGMGEDKGNY